MSVQGRNLKVGDTIHVWFRPRLVTITELTAHPDPHNLFGGEGRVAKFAQCSFGMTVEPNGLYEVEHRP